MSDFADISMTVAWMQRSRYCLVPAGDTPSVTQRFPAAVACGCVPVYVDPYARVGAERDGNAALNATFPLHRTIDWSRAAVRTSGSSWRDPDDPLIPRGDRGEGWKVSKELGRRMQYDLQRPDDASQGVLDELRLLLAAQSGHRRQF